MFPAWVLTIGLHTQGEKGTVSARLGDVVPYGGERLGLGPRNSAVGELGDFGQITLLPDPQMSHLENGELDVLYSCICCRYICILVLRMSEQ